MTAIRFTILAALSAAFLAACGTGASNAPAAAPAGLSTRALPAMQQVPFQGHAAPLQTSPAGASSTADGVTVGSPSGEIQRSVTASYTVPQGGFLSAFETVTARGVQLGGYVQSSRTSPNAGGRIVSGSVTLAIPAGQLAAFLNGMPSDFAASSIDFSSIDHTADFIDVNARLASANAHLAALQHLLAHATSLDDITTLEGQIEQVQQEIDTDQGQINLLTDAVTYATATVQLSERGVVAASPPPPISNGVASGWSNALLLMGVVVAVVITAAPLLCLALLAALAWRWVGRRALHQRSVP